MNGCPLIVLDGGRAAPPLYRQIYQAVRTMILKGDLRAATRLPASRLLARQLGVSRLTVVSAYEQLLAEGYVEGKVGAGTFVAAELPDEMLRTPVAQTFDGRSPAPPRVLKLSPYGQRIAESGPTVLQSQPAKQVAPFQTGVTAIDHFPFDLWARIARRCYRQAPGWNLGYGEPGGYRPLREAIASHLASVRGVRCDLEQIIITNGSQQALDLIGRVLLNRRDSVLIEDPCYPEARDIFRSTGARLIPSPVDGEGFDIKAALRHDESARLAYVTPSHQYPCGVTMSLARRLKLLEWAEARNALIVEDDYDSEFRYAGRPLASLHGLDRHGRVLYVGTFSNSIFPALRLGCMVVPHDLIGTFTRARVLCDWQSPVFEQLILAEFISEGHFARHIRRMRTLYERRRHVLLAEAAKHLDGLLEVTNPEAGMHLVGWLPAGVSDQLIARKSAAERLNLAPISAYSVGTLERGGLLLGYAAFNERQIKQAIKKLASILRGFDATRVSV